MEKADREFILAHKYDYIVVNDDVNNAADRIMAIIRAEHARTERSIHAYMNIFKGEDAMEFGDEHGFTYGGAIKAGKAFHPHTL